MRFLGTVAFLLAGLTVAPCGCGNRSATSVAAGLQSEHPSERVEACVRAAQRGELSVLPLLVERLEDPAADVRLFAISALRRMTGRTFGYRYFDKPDERFRAADRWRRWLKARRASAAGG